MLAHVVQRMHVRSVYVLLNVWLDVASNPAKVQPALDDIWCSLQLFVVL